VPGKIVNLPLERPVICFFAHTAISHRNYRRFLADGPKSSSPRSAHFHGTASVGIRELSIFYPLPEWIAPEFIFSGEKMNVIRQHDITSDCPLWRLCPCLSDQIMDFLASEYTPALMRAGGYEKNHANVTDGHG
jgi:hypothetical protein